jgi:hypothetical protein
LRITVCKAIIKIIFIDKVWNAVAAKKSLKIPKGYSESVKRRTDNTMAKRKRTNNDLQSYT